MERPPSGSTSLVGGSVAGRFSIIEELGESGTGRNYAVIDGEPQWRATLKILHARSDPEGQLLDRLREHFERTGNIRHLNVAYVREVGATTDGLLFVVMEDLGGGLLSKVLASRKALDSPTAIDVVLQVAAGLRAVHDAGLTHGALSPSSIFVARENDGRLRAALADAGLASMLRASAGNAAVRSSDDALYMSPERIGGGTPDERSDVFSLGAVLYHLVSGRTPTEGWELSGGELPAPLFSPLWHSLAASSKDRFGSVAEFIHAVENAQGEVAELESRSKRRWAGGFAVAAIAVAALLVLRPFDRLAESLRERLVVAWTPTGSDGASDSMAVGEQEPMPQSPRVAPRAVPRATSDEPSRATARAIRLTSAAPERRSTDTEPSDDPEPSDPASTASTSASDESLPRPTSPRASMLPSLEQQAGVYRRVGLDDAVRQLGERLHVVEDRRTEMVGLMRGSQVPGADPGRPVVRAVYFDALRRREQGSTVVDLRLIFLDQQRLTTEASSARAVPEEPSVVIDGDESRATWREGSTWLSLHGRVDPATLRKLANQVR